MITLALLSHSKQRHFFLFNQVLTYWARSFWLSVNASAHKSWIDDTLLRRAPTSYLSHQLKVLRRSFRKTTKYLGTEHLIASSSSPIPFVKDNCFNPTKQKLQGAQITAAQTQGFQLGHSQSTFEPFCMLPFQCSGFSEMLTFNVWQLVKWVPARNAHTLAALFINICTTGHRAS